MSTIDRRYSILLLVVLIGLSGPAGAFAQFAQGPKRPAFEQQGYAMPYPDTDRPRKTSSGERYSPSAMTAAHRTLPFGTSIELTNLSSGRKVVVKVNDRGPYVPDRIVDISEAAARVLGFSDEGGRVRLRVVDGLITADAHAALRLEQDQPTVNPPSDRRRTGEFTVQLGSYAEESLARKRAEGIEGAWIYRTRVDGTWYYRVNFGVFGSRWEAEGFRRRLLDNGVEGFVKSVEEHEKDTVID